MNMNKNIGRGLHFCCSTNSTMFTNCCDAAIMYERACPACGKLIIGHEAETDHERFIIRWISLYPKH
jgi:hypothetical protein